MSRSPESDPRPFIGDNIGLLQMRVIEQGEHIKLLQRENIEQRKTIGELNRMLDKLSWVLAACGEYLETGDDEDLRI